MKIQFVRFNIYLFLFFLAFGTGCKTSEEKQRAQEISMLRLHLESRPDVSPRTELISLSRQQPVFLHVERVPFLDEGDLEMAGITPGEFGGFAIKIQFNRRGAWLLENITASNPQKRIAIFADFGETRWLAAPQINRRISDGIVVFTPDANYDESERLVRGLNNFILKAQKRNRF